jgi:hypothetical protein
LLRGQPRKVVIEPLIEALRALHAQLLMLDEAY